MNLFGFVRILSMYNSQKKKEAENFKIQKLIEKVDGKNLSQKNYEAKRSNILAVLDTYSELIRSN